jgi:hypothetical protein
LVELSLASGRTPRTDRFLDHPHGAPVPYPPLVHASLAMLASLGQRSEAGPTLGGVDEDELERVARDISPLLGALATTLAFLLGILIAPGPRRLWAGLAAAALYALLPTAVAREAVDGLYAQPWIALLVCGELAAIAFALRAGQQIDLTLGALLAGFCSGASLLAGPEAWPVSVATVGVLLGRMWVVPRESKRDAWRAASLFALVTIAVTLVAEPGATLALFRPEFASAQQARGLLQRDAGTLVIGLVAFPATWFALFARRRDPFHAVVLAAGFLAFACSLFDARFLATWHVLFAATLAIVVAWPPFETRKSVRRAASVALALALLVPSALDHAEAARLRAEVAANREEFALGLEWLRTNAPSPGPFNSSEAPQDWCVLTSPALAGSVAYYARKPLFASSIDGAPVAKEAEVGDVFASGDGATLAARLARSGAVYVVVSPFMRSDSTLPAAGGGAVLGALAAPASDPSRGADTAGLAQAGFERVYASRRIVHPVAPRAPATPDDGGPLLSIWRAPAPAIDHQSQLSPAKH